MLRTLFGLKSRDSTETGDSALPAGTRVYAVGDIHGRSDLLDRLHAMIEDDLRASARVPDTRIIYLGDYIDRGPDSAGVLNRLTSAPPGGMQRTLLRGNHEDFLLQFLQTPEHGAAWRQQGGLETLMSYRINVRKILSEKGYSGLADELERQCPPGHIQALRNLPTSFAVGGYFFCHAGVRPGVPLDRQQPDDLLWIREEFLTSNARFEKIIVHGHTPVEQPEFRPNRINIDTGAYATNRLTCLVLEENKRRIIHT